MTVQQEFADGMTGEDCIDTLNNLLMATQKSERVVTANTTATSTDYGISCDATSGAISVTLPTITGIAGQRYQIDKLDASANAVTILGYSSETIDDQPTLVLTQQYESKVLKATADGWTVEASKLVLDAPNNPPSLDEDGNLPAIITLRSGTASALNAIVLEDKELAIETVSSVARYIRVGDGTTAGGVTPVQADVINLQFGGAYPAYPESVSDVTWTEITGSSLATNNPRYYASYFALFSVPANTGLEFFWKPWSIAPVNIRVVPSSALTYYTEGGMTVVYCPTTESGVVMVGFTGLVQCGNLSAEAAKFRCKAVPGGADKIICSSLYCEYRKIPVAPVP